MSGPSDRLRLVRQWVEKAEHDHAQPCAEKYLQALLVDRGIDFPKTHDLRVLVQLTGIRERELGAAVSLNRYAIEARYPGD